MRTRSVCLFFACLSLPVMLFAQPSRKDTLVGVWGLTISQTGQRLPPLLALFSFSEDGSLTTTARNPIENKTNPVLQAAADEMGVGYGRWIRTGDSKFRMTFYITLLKAGAVSGVVKVEGIVALSESSDEFSGHSQGAFLDANWNVLLSAASELEGTRLETP